MKSWFRKKKIKSESEFDNICLERKFVFIHVPKNAGTSICKSLGLDVTRHYTVQEYIGMLSQKKYSELFSFAFVRNPFARFISLYNYARMEESYYHSSINPKKALYGKHMDFEKLKFASIEDAANMLVDGELVHNPPHNQWKPQSFWLKDIRGDLNVSFIGRIENIEADIQKIVEKLDIGGQIELPVINVSSNETKDYRKLINSDARSILEYYYNEDLETFNYEF